MNYLRLWGLLPFLILTALCVSYAHSQNKEERRPDRVYRGWGCELTVTLDGTQVSYKVPYSSKSKFFGPWAASPGALTLWTPAVPMLGFEGEPVRDERLDITFAKQGEQIVPVSFQYVDLDAQRKNALIAPHHCGGLQEVH